MRLKQHSRSRVSGNGTPPGTSRSRRTKTVDGTSNGAGAGSNVHSIRPELTRSDPPGHASGQERARAAVDALLLRFESYLQQHALSPTTVRNYLADLRAFSRWHLANQHSRPGRYAPADFKSYRNYLCNETEHSTATVNRRLQSLRLFGRFLQELGHVAENPTREIKLLQNGKGPETAPRILTHTEIARLVEAVRSGRPSLVERDHAIMQLMLQAGLRVHEVAALRLRDLMALSRGMAIEVGGQHRNGSRRIPLNAVAARALRDYIAVRPAIPRVETVFVSQRGQSLSMRSIQRVIDTHANAAGLQGVCAQSLRHTCAQMMLEDTRDAALVAQRLGQRSARGLNRYRKG